MELRFSMFSDWQGNVKYHLQRIFNLCITLLKKQSMRIIQATTVHVSSFLVCVFVVNKVIIQLLSSPEA